MKNLYNRYCEEGIIETQRDFKKVKKEFLKKRQHDLEKQFGKKNKININRNKIIDNLDYDSAND